MYKTDFMVIGSFVKVLLILVGLFTALTLFIIGFAKKNRKKLDKAAMIFFGTCFIVIILSVIEFLFLANC